MFLSATYAEEYIGQAKKLMANAYIGREESAKSVAAAKKSRSRSED
jgi:hypothetical protein